MWSYIAIAGMAVDLIIKWNKLQMTVKHSESIAKEMERLRSIDYRIDRKKVVPDEKRINPVNNNLNDLHLPKNQPETVKKTWSDSDFV